MNENEDRTMLILQALNALRRAVATLAVVMILCTAAIILALWNAEFTIGIFVMLGILLIAFLVAAFLGATTAKAINKFRR